MEENKEDRGRKKRLNGATRHHLRARIKDHISSEEARRYLIATRAPPEMLTPLTGGKRDNLDDSSSSSAGNPLKRLATDSAEV